VCQRRCFSIFLLCVNQVRTLCRSDPTENDSVEGLRPNARGPGLVTFGVRVLSVCSPSLQEKYCDIFWDRFVSFPATQVESMVY